MQACKSTYNYTTLISNYITHNCNNKISYNREEALPSKFTSTAQNRLSFNDTYLISYRTRVAKFIHTKKDTYLFIDKYNYSVTTSKQLNLLHWLRPENIITIYVTDIDNDFKTVLNDCFNDIYDNYKYCKRGRNGKRIREAIEASKSAILSILPELHPSTRKATIRKLQELPSIPDKLNKFTRPILLSVLKYKGLLDGK